MGFNQRFYLFCALLLFSVATVAGPYAPPADEAGTTAIDKDDNRIIAWANNYHDYLPGPNVDNEFQTPAKAEGQAEGNSFDVVSLGDKGQITMSFAGTISNGPGWDFAVFENSFSHTFLELAFVEVSSNGTAFVRFPAVSFTAQPVGFATPVDATDIDGLAGKYKQGFGTPFDLDVLAAVPTNLLDINAVQFIRLIDIKGDGTEFDVIPAQFGGPNPIYDVFPTTGSGGFDLDGIGARYFSAVPTPLPPAMLMLLAPLVVLMRRQHRA